MIFILLTIQKQLYVNVFLMIYIEFLNKQVHLLIYFQVNIQKQKSKIYVFHYRSRKYLSKIKVFLFSLNILNQILILSKLNKQLIFIIFSRPILRQFLFKLINIYLLININSQILHQKANLFRIELSLFIDFSKQLEIVHKFNIQKTEVYLFFHKLEIL